MAEDPSRSQQTAPTSSSAVTLPKPLLAADLKPGDLVWVTMPNTHVVGSEQQKQRPWLVISPEYFNKGKLGLFIAVPTSSKVSMYATGSPSRIKFDSQQVTYADKALPDGFKLYRQPRVALSDQVRTLSEKRILARPGTVQSKVLDSVREGVAFNIGAS